jgi:hypothetical protein
MHKIYLLLIFFLITISGPATAQNRNATVKVLNNYVLYNNANITALIPLVQSLERYNDLFNSCLRRGRPLGGEKYERPKESPFVDINLFTVGEDDPETLYKKALKESTVLPVVVKKDLNTAMSALHISSQRLVQLVDSMSNLFSGPLIVVTKEENNLPYRLLKDASNQLKWSKKYRDQLWSTLNEYYIQNGKLNTVAGDYIRSVDQLNKGMAICQRMMNDLSKNESKNLSFCVKELDSLYSYLEASELILLKGIKPVGNSKHFPNRSYYYGFDLYNKYEEVISGFNVFSIYGKRFVNKMDHNSADITKCQSFHAELANYFNSYGLSYYYNEYVLLIGGGKMKVESEVGTLWKGWTDGKTTLPMRTLLFWAKEIPLFEIKWP